MGASHSSVPRDAPGTEELGCGLDNFGNTCYINSVVQALYCCKGFRTQLLDYVNSLPNDCTDNGVLCALAKLFTEIEDNKRRGNVLAPRNFVRVVQHANQEFHNYMHQDAQELLSFVLNRISDTVRETDKDIADQCSASQSPGNENTESASSPPSNERGVASDGHDGAAVGAGPESFGMVAGGRADTTAASTSSGADAESQRSASQHQQEERESQKREALRTWIEDTFVGQTVTNTMCMNCEKVSKKKEDFMELKVEMERPDTTLARCMLATSEKELLQADNKLHCTGCNSYAEGYKWVEISAFPPVLIIHFNRFAFTPTLEQGHKLKQRIAFPNRLRPPPETHCVPGEGIAYDLVAVVVHVGTSLAHGHYITYARVGGGWYLFDDAAVARVSQREVEHAFGDATAWLNNDTHAYLLFYELSKGGGGTGIDAQEPLRTP